MSDRTIDTLANRRLRAKLSPNTSSSIERPRRILHHGLNRCTGTFVKENRAMWIEMGQRNKISFGKVRPRTVRRSGIRNLRRKERGTSLLDTLPHKIGLRLAQDTQILDVNRINGHGSRPSGVAGGRGKSNIDRDMVKRIIDGIFPI